MSWCDARSKNVYQKLAPNSILSIRSVKVYSTTVQLTIFFELVSKSNTHFYYATYDANNGITNY